jgi:hypothetical protein
VQLVPPVQAVPQVPQLPLSEVVSTHAPLQSVRPAPHVAAHAPALHTSPPVHAFPQPPQFAGSDVESTHAPEHTTKPAEEQTHVLLALQT